MRSPVQAWGIPLPYLFRLSVVTISGSLFVDVPEPLFQPIDCQHGTLSHLENDPQFLTDAVAFSLPNPASTPSRTRPKTNSASSG